MIKSILGGKSKNLCDFTYLLTLPPDETFVNQGFSRVLINAEPNTTYTFSRENANQITDFGIAYLAISAYDDISHNNWLSHPDVPVLNNKSATLTTGSEGKLWILFNDFFYKDYRQKNINPFGYIQLEKGSTATEYVPHELTSYKSIMKVGNGRFVTSFDERMSCKTKNLITAQQMYQISRDMIVTIWQGEVNYICTFSYELAMIEPNTEGEALFQFGYSDGTYSYIVHRDKYTVLSQITDSKKLTKIELVNWSNVKGIISNIQLEKGTTATDYVPFGYV